MKKILLVLLIISSCSFVFADSPSKLTSALKNCSAYSEGGTINTERMNVSSQKKILGMKNGKCAYQEKTTFPQGELTISCEFTKAQAEELARVMDAYETLQQYSTEKVDTSSYSAVENNPVVKTWAKYLQDPSVCKVN